MSITPQSSPYQELGAGIFTPPSCTLISNWSKTAPGERKFPGTFALLATRQSSCRTPGAGMHGDGKKMVCYTIRETGVQRPRLPGKTHSPSSRLWLPDLGTPESVGARGATSQGYICFSSPMLTSVFLECVYISRLSQVVNK